MIHQAKPDEHLWVHSMGKRFRVRAVTTSDEESNTFMERHPDTGVIACFGPFQITANFYEGLPTNRDLEDFISTSDARYPAIMHTKGGSY